MDLNAKSPSSQWEWDRLQLQPPKWNIELDRENNVWLFDTPTGSGYSGSELIRGSMSGSSKSDSISSSPTTDISKTCKFAFESSHDDSNCKIELPKEGPIEASNAPMLSCVSSEPLLNLKLGKRMKFEDVSSLVVGRKCKSNGQNLQCPPLCQVEGCGLDLSSAKHYYRKRRVCVDHSKSPMVVIDGLERRFCQQCSRFHDLFEFDGKKKSCRRRLSQHNARRHNHSRKTAQSSQLALSSSPCDEKQQMNPFAYSKTAINLALQNIQNSELPQTKDFLLKPTNDNIGTPSTVTMLSDDSGVHFTSKVLETKSINADVEDFISFSDTDDTQDFTCASSLLSTSPWDSYATKSVSLAHSDRTTSTAQSITHTTSQHMPLASSEYWHSDLYQHINSSMWISNSNCEDSDHFQEFQCSENLESCFHRLD